jgi:two-component system response regulator QseB/two-component system response regulator TctD
MLNLESFVMRLSSSAGDSARNSSAAKELRAKGHHDMRTLVVEDTSRLLQLLAEKLGEGGFTVDAVSTAKAFRECSDAYRHVLYLVDLGLPDDDGMNLIRTARQAHPNTMILVVTGRSQISDRVEALNFGADDYLVKPFHATELIARVRALMRRAHEPAPRRLQVGELVLYCETNEVFCHGTRIDLTPSELRLLVLFIRRSGHLVAKEAIESTLQKMGSETTPNALEKVVSRLRHSLAARPAGITLKTVKGLGYILEEP